eukprot:5344995-Pleurochrysis_carterae.AAC.3
MQSTLAVASFNPHCTVALGAHQRQAQASSKRFKATSMEMASETKRVAGALWGRTFTTVWAQTLSTPRGGL